MPRISPILIDTADFAARLRRATILKTLKARLVPAGDRRLGRVFDALYATETLADLKIILRDWPLHEMQMLEQIARVGASRRQT